MKQVDQILAIASKMSIRDLNKTIKALNEIVDEKNRIQKAESYINKNKFKVGSKAKFWQPAKGRKSRGGLAFRINITKKAQWVTGTIMKFHDDNTIVMFRPDGSKVSKRIEISKLRVV